MSSATERRLAIVYEPESIPLLKLVGVAARNDIHCVWVTDDVDVKALRRFGSVVSTGEHSVADVAERLAQLDVAGVTTFADTGITRAAELATRLGLPTNTIATAHRLVDKIAQRQALAEAGVPGPTFVGVRADDTIAERGALLRGLTYPVVVKPALGFGGRDTLCLRDPHGVLAELELRRRAAPERSVIVEECLGPFPPRSRGGFGDYVSVELVAHGDTTTVVAVTGRMPLVDPFRETGAFLPSTLASGERSAVADMAVRAAHALQVRYGCLHVEMKLTAEGPRVIEVNGRVGGGGIADLVSAFTGVDLFECALESALGRRVHQQQGDDGAAGVHYQLALQPPLDHRVRLKPDWQEHIHGVCGLQHVMLRSDEAEVGLRDGSYGYLLMASGVAADHDALLETYRVMNSLMVTP